MDVIVTWLFMRFCALYATHCIFAGDQTLAPLKSEDVISLLHECLVMAHFLGDAQTQAAIYSTLGDVFRNNSQIDKAIQYYEKVLFVFPRVTNSIKMDLYQIIGSCYETLYQYQRAIDCYDKSRCIAVDIGDSCTEQTANEKLGDVFFSLGQYHKASEYHTNRLDIAKKLGNRSDEGRAYGSLGNAYKFQGEYNMALDCYEKCLRIASEVGDKAAEELAYGGLGIVYSSIGQYHKAIDYHKLQLNISREIGSREGEGNSFRNLGNDYQSLGEYDKAIDYHEKSLMITKEIGDKKMEGIDYASLGSVYSLQGKYHKAIDYHKLNLKIAEETHYRFGIEVAYSNLGNIYQKLGEYNEAIEYTEKCLRIAKEMSHKEGEGDCNGILGACYCQLGEYHRALEHFERGLDIAKKIGDRQGEHNAYANIGIAYQNIGEFDKAVEYYKKSLAISTEIDYKNGQGRVYGNLGNNYSLSGKYEKAIGYYEKRLNIALEIGDHEAEGNAYGGLANCYSRLEKYEQAIEFCQKRLRIAEEIGDTIGEGNACNILGNVLWVLRNFKLSLEFQLKYLDISQDIGDKRSAGVASQTIGMYYKRETSIKDLQKAKDYLQESLKWYEQLFDDLKENDHFKISLAETYIDTYKLLSEVYIENEETDEALLACERGRARALLDLLSFKYNLDQISLRGKGSISEMPEITRNACVVFYDVHRSKLYVHSWVIPPHPHQMFFYNEKTKREGLVEMETNLLEDDNQEASNGHFKDLVEESYSSMMVREGMNCEDRSLEILEYNDQVNNPDPIVPLGGTAASNVPHLLKRNLVCPPEEDETRPLELLFDRLFSPLLHKLSQDEIIIIPDGPLFMVPFAALQDPETDKYLSETKRIRLAPSLTTLKILQESSDEHFCKSGALIVGNPATGNVNYRGKERKITSLPAAEDEAIEIGKFLGVQPLIGEQATKEIILEKLQQGVSVIHFAAHGSARNGQIFLAPSKRSIDTVPEERDYILTMKEAQDSGIRAQLVVLSCCHSGRGEIKSEGVVGMARAFLAAGARAVVASLWAIDDLATKYFMLKFYSHLKKGESASRSLQQAMKEMREMDAYKEPMYWAAFFLIGDNVTITM